MATDERLFALRDRIHTAADANAHDTDIAVTCDTVYDPAGQGQANTDARAAFHGYVADVVAKRHGDGKREVNDAIAALPAPQ